MILRVNVNKLVLINGFLPLLQLFSKACFWNMLDLAGLFCRMFFGSFLCRFLAFGKKETNIGIVAQPN